MAGDYPKYEAWIRTRQCAACQSPGPSDPHHLKGLPSTMGLGLYLRGGAGGRASDLLLMPLCRMHHDKLHHEGPALYPEQWEWVAMSLAQAIIDGVFPYGRS